MIILEAATTLAAGASAATQVTSTVFGMELASGTETYKVLDQRQLASSAATIYTVPASTVAFIKAIHVVNNDTVTRTAQYYRNGTAASNAITPAISIPAGGWATYEDGQGWQIYNGNGEIQQEVPPLQVGFTVSTALSSDATANSTTTNAEITGLTIATLTAGTYYYKYAIRYVSSITTTGVKFAVDMGGTVTSHVYNLYYVDASATASTGAASQAANASTAQVFAAYSSRADNTTLGPTLSTDTTGDMFAIIEGLVTTSTSGNIRLMHGSETAASTTVKASTCLMITRVA